MIKFQDPVFSVLPVNTTSNSTNSTAPTGIETKQLAKAIDDLLLNSTEQLPVSTLVLFSSALSQATVSEDVSADELVSSVVDAISVVW